MLQPPDLYCWLPAHVAVFVAVFVAVSKPSPDHSSADDPPPQPPRRPEPDDCCRSGCEPCVFDLYDEAVERYRAALAAWQARQASTSRR
ncbi:oxidoreductase-like domain-containing protein [Paraburkholderia megapolitana]|uniref:oxidoreductase-like domain-containing protein n=1 Tax=Paraburkholderia megapolitana TaxID=420953 RepID=UPI0038BAAF52